MADVPNLRVPAQVTLSYHRGKPFVFSPADARWLAVEFAAAALDGPGPDEALALLTDRFPDETVEACLAAVAGSDHPDADRVASAVRAFVDSGAVASINQVYQLKVALTRWRPPIWRRVRVPATMTLGDLHSVIQILFGWDGDHLHQFRAGTRHYSDLNFNLEDVNLDEFTTRLRSVLAGTTKKIQYEYDLGASWWHEITLEQVLERKPDTTYPVCTAFAGDSPVEYSYEEDPREPETFDLAEVNRRLAGTREDL
ncbi:plasmid pRiA4b ORF-3 family protein [Actinoplanes cyaneus]|uniref:plasmid pRiA4b ORF-3 family protein n=1 Tax=Actinoplanes cyaneus TaxID=52696 RepID=UPI001943D2B3|nr:plasmid pRiA4b ORF-3 family protein [Actinoplanes cyaneus]MCW2144455.1 pRiA4b ORF-3-like protein [Actinoplanes cyaneus]